MQPVVPQTRGESAHPPEVFIEQAIVGNPGLVLDLLDLRLRGAGFLVERPSEMELIGRSPGMHNNHENALRGLGDVRIQARDGVVSLHSDLRGIRLLRAMMLFMPAAMGLSMGVFFFFLFDDIQPLLTPLLAVSPWLVIGPVLYWRLRESVRLSALNLMAGLERVSPS